MKNRFIVLSLLWGIFLLTSCGQDIETLQVTVDSQIASSVRSTVSAMPTATAHSTYTPYPTFTPLATATPYATYTPLPTFTPQPTFTMSPTDTPVPTDTAEPTATATTTQATTNTAPANAAAPPAPAQPTSAPPADIQAQVLAAVDSLLHDIDVYVSAITAQFRGVSSGGNIISGGFDKTVNCQDVVTSYNHGIIPLQLDVSQATIPVQNAYNSYLTAIPLFQQATQVWAEVCQTALANGETKEIGDQDRGNIGRQMDTLKNMLNGVANELRTP